MEFDTMTNRFNPGPGPYDVGVDRRISGLSGSRFRTYTPPKDPPVLRWTPAPKDPQVEPPTKFPSSVIDRASYEAYMSENYPSIKALTYLRAFKMKYGRWPWITGRAAFPDNTSADDTGDEPTVIDTVTDVDNTPVYTDDDDEFHTDGAIERSYSKSLSSSSSSGESKTGYIFDFVGLALVSALGIGMLVKGVNK